MKEQLEILVKYNLWANQALIAYIDKNAGAFLDREIPSSFPSLRKTLFHIWDAEHIWLMRMKGLSLKGFPSKDYDPATPPEKMLDTSRDFAAFVQESSPDGNTRYTNLKGEEFTQPNWQIVMHCMNHSTFHRGQLVTMLRTMGMTELPSTDLVNYLRTV